MVRFARGILCGSLLLVACSDDGKSAESGLDGGEGADAGDRADGGARDASDHGWDGRIPEPGDVRLNEIDCSGDRVELVNVGSSARSLAAFALADDLSAGAPSQALEGTIAAGEYKVVVVSAFGVKCSGEDVFLSEGATLSDVAPGGAVPSGATWGRLPDHEGDFALNRPTLGAANAAWVDPSPALFQPLADPVTFELTVTSADADALRSDPRTHVHATLTVRAGDVREGPYDIGLRLKGSIGSFRDFDSKPALKIDANRYVPGQYVFGQSKITLNNMVQDPSTIHEWLGYQLFAALDVPAPRTGYAKVTVNGADYGIYVLLEDTTTTAYLGQNFDSTQGLYEPAEGADLLPEQVPGFDVKQGSTTDFSELLAIAEPLAHGAPGAWFDAIGDKIDWAQVLRVQGVDIVSGNNDGYVALLNNYVLHVDKAGTLRMLPWGIDASFTADVPFFESRGILIARCLEDTRCVDTYLDALADVRTKARAFLASDVAQKARELGARHAQLFASDTSWGYDAAQIPDEVTRSLERLELNLDRLESLLDCQNDATNDSDGDGRRCALDCAEGDATRYRGAPEVCGDAIDQSCNGIADDGEACPACVTDPDDSSIIVCPRAETMASLRASCQALGATPVSIDDAGENDRVRSAASRLITNGELFIGLTDESTTDTFVWTGAPGGDYRNFFDGYPYARNVGQGPRCAVLSTEDGGWRTALCDAYVPGVCER